MKKSIIVKNVNFLLMINLSSRHKKVININNVLGVANFVESLINIKVVCRHLKSVLKIRR